MRDIIFRGKRVDNGEWVYGYYVLNAYLPGTIEEEIYPTIHPSTENHKDPIFRVTPFSVGQYTGLKDKNGTRIFEGDVIKFDIPKGDWGDIAVMIFESGEFRYKPITNAERVWNCRLCGEEESSKVIGNVYDNPELLEVTT